MFYEVIPTKVFRNNASALTYFSELTFSPGQIVLVPLGKLKIPGIVVKRVPEPSFSCKSIIKPIYDIPLPKHILKAIFWLSSYYLSPLPLVASLVLPVGIEKKRRTSAKNGKTIIKSNTVAKHSLNPSQTKALSQLASITNPTKLLFGVTGSGKTNIYLNLTKKAISQQQSVILLVPEIALTSQLVQIFESSFPHHVQLIHSRQTEAERHQIWTEILNSKSPKIIIGPRSALFAPVENLGLIIIDESHESTYYQENSPKYSALRLASFYATTLKIPCLLGSATPLVSDYYLASTKKAVVSLTEKAKSTAKPPDIKVVNFSSRESFTRNRYFSDNLLDTISDNLRNGYQTLIYHNRRGSSPLTICENCGWQALCPNCFLPLTLHTDSYSLICHTCGHTETIPSSCPDCHRPNVIHKGFGTKLLESELSKIFKDARIARFDADNKKNETLDSLYDEVKNGDVQIIIGTQTISRGLDLPQLASIGIVQADSGLFLPDYTSEEKTFELLTQVIGRVGRGHLDKASVIIQTFQPDSPIINFAIKSDYPGFYEYMIQKRKKQSFPPFVYLAKVVLTYKTEKTTISKIRNLAKEMNNFITRSKFTSIEISSPMPCFHEHTQSGFSWQLILKAKNRTQLIKLLSLADTPHVSIDPPSLL